MIVGSGASAVHFALSVLYKGYHVKMLDIGFKKPETNNPHFSFNELKQYADDPVQYLLGRDYEAVSLPTDETVYYGFPPSKQYIFKPVPQFKFKAEGFKPLFSFAQGGLAEAWTAGVYPFNDEELTDFPFSYADIAPYYGELAKRIGISGEADDLIRFYPFHENVMPPLELDLHSKILLRDYADHKTHLNRDIGVYLGRSRLATLSQDKDGRKACCYSGRCHWGCPTQSLYTPSSTLHECQQYSNFQYLPQMYVKHFDYNHENRITAVVTEEIDTEKLHQFNVDKLVLAAGTLSSSKIFMESVFQKTGTIIKLPGLMDNRQVWAPFVNLKMIGKQFDPESYQYHQVVVGMNSDRPKEFVHGLITTLTTALIHPLIQNMPLSLKASSFLFRDLHAGLGLVNVNFHDTRRKANFLTLETDGKSSDTILKIKYSPPKDENNRIAKNLKRLRKALRRIGCIAPSRMQEKRPMGASIHYAGTLPMSKKKDTLTTSNFCRSHDFPNLYIVDGTTFPFLPAKNLTLTLMANAIRVAEAEF